MPRHLSQGDSPSRDAPASPVTAGPPGSAGGRGPPRGLFSFLRAHPIVCLLLLTPGIPEYLSSSSPLDAIILNPAQFGFQLIANLGLYGPGVLLIREAMIRWRKGWATVLLLGAAYGILEEGIGLSTLFNPQAGPVGQMGYFGHWLGVSWIWVALILPVHMIFSISIPILLLGLALPSTRGRSLLSRRGIVGTFAILAVDVTGLFLLIYFGVGFWMGYPVLLGSFLAIGVLAYMARHAPSGRPLARTALPLKRPRTMFALGVIFYPTALITESFGMGLHLPAFIVFVLVIIIQALFLVYVLRVIGHSSNEPQLVVFTFGLVIPIAAIGLIATIGFPVALVGDLVMVLFFRKLWRRYQHHPLSAVSSPTLG
ncbi:MAG: hypothetical protein OK449_01455 [Thaumarchaeota archaeon]|nr:hypothetical protein [Nitrososphaerota archaeon]